MDTNHMKCMKSSCCGRNKKGPVPRPVDPPLMDALKIVNMLEESGLVLNLNCDLKLTASFYQNCRISLVDLA